MKHTILTAVAVLLLSACSGGGGGGSDNNSGPNQSPVAYAGDDRQVASGNTVTLDSSLCSDADGDALSYDWHFVSRPQASTTVLSDANAANPAFLADAAGEYIIELTVSDGRAAASDSVIIQASAGAPGLDCAGIVPGENLTDDFVCAHNAVRANAQPAPSPALPEMVWDPALAQIAQDYAETCNWPHNPNRGDNYPGSVGENLYASNWPDNSVEAAIQSWADEAGDYDYDSNTCRDGQICGHYTQMVWRESLKVGCARVFCPEVGGIPNAHYYVCNYAPSGNINIDTTRPY